MELKQIMLIFREIDNLFNLSEIYWTNDIPHEYLDFHTDYDGFLEFTPKK